MLKYLIPILLFSCGATAMRLDKNVSAKVSINGQGIAPLFELLNLQKNQNMQLSKDLLIHRSNDTMDFTTTWLTVVAGYASKTANGKTTSHSVKTYSVNVTTDVKYADAVAKLPKHFMLDNPHEVIHVNLLRLGKVGMPDISVQIKIESKTEIEGHVE